MKCDKCLTDEQHGVHYCIYHPTGKKEYFLCHFCNNLFNPEPNIVAFMRDDYEGHHIERVGKAMIEARKKRALGESPWESKDNLQN